MQPIDFKKPKIVMFIGKPNTGKSNAIKFEVIKNVNNKIWSIGLIFTNSAFNNKEYDYMPRKYIIEGYKENILKKFVGSLKKYVKKHGKTLNSYIIFDDLIGLLNTRNNPYLINLISIHRHIGLSILISAQVFKSSATSTVVRCCVNYGIFFRSEKNDIIKAIYDEFGTEFASFEEFKTHFLKVTKKPYTALFYDQDTDSKENNFFAIKYPDVSKIKIELSF